LKKRVWLHEVNKTKINFLISIFKYKYEKKQNSLNPPAFEKIASYVDGKTVIDILWNRFIYSYIVDVIYKGTYAWNKRQVYIK